MEREIRALTSLRFLAALVVFLHHFSGVSYGIMDNPLSSIAVEGHIGVTVFFVLSGFLITWRYLADIRAKHFDWRDYLWRRVIRIVPLYWALLLLTFWVNHGNLPFDGQNGLRDLPLSWWLAYLIPLTLVVLIGCVAGAWAWHRERRTQQPRAVLATAANAMLVYAVLVFLAYAWLAGALRLDPQSLLNWLLLQGYFDPYKFTGISTAWTLSVEMTFYILAPLLLMTLVRAGRGWWLALAAWVIGMYGMGWLLIQASNASGIAQAVGFMNHMYQMGLYTLFGRLFDFAVGIGVAWWALRLPADFWRGWRVWAAEAAVIGGFGLVIALQYGMNQSGGWAFVDGSIPRGWGYNYAIALVTGGVIWALLCPHTLSARLLGDATLVFAGRISYALYLVQMTPLFLNNRVLFDATHWLLVPALYGFASIISAFFYLYVEKPAQRWLARVPAWARKNDKPPQPVAV
jgi:peptidoglycan/LPS O-acetylase OafA/YrhL